MFLVIYVMHTPAQMTNFNHTVGYVYFWDILIEKRDGLYLTLIHTTFLSHEMFNYLNHNSLFLMTPLILLIHIIPICPFSPLIPLNLLTLFFMSSLAHILQPKNREPLSSLPKQMFLPRPTCVIQTLHLALLIFFPFMGLYLWPNRHHFLIFLTALVNHHMGFPLSAHHKMISLLLQMIEPFLFTPWIRACLNPRRTHHAHKGTRLKTTKYRKFISHKTI